MTNTFQPPRTPAPGPQSLHYLHHRCTSDSEKQCCGSERQWLSQWDHDRRRHTPPNQLSRHTHTHTHAFCLQRKNDERGPTRSSCQRTGSWGAEHNAARSRLAPVSHITALCGEPHSHHTPRHGSIYDHMEGEEPYWDIGCVCWPEKQRSGFWDSSGKEQKHYWISGWPLDVWQGCSRERTAKLHPAATVTVWWCSWW